MTGKSRGGGLQRTDHGVLQFAFPAQEINLLISSPRQPCKTTSDSAAQSTDMKIHPALQPVPLHRRQSKPHRKRPSSGSSPVPTILAVGCMRKHISGRMHEKTRRRRVDATRSIPTSMSLKNRQLGPEPAEADLGLRCLQTLDRFLHFPDLRGLDSLSQAS